MRERPRRVERQFVETHAIWAWHAIIFLLLTFVDAVMGYAILAGSKPLHIPTITMWTARCFCLPVGAVHSYDGYDYDRDRRGRLMDSGGIHRLG